MQGLNRVTLIGHLGKDPELRQISSEVEVAKVSFATSENYRDKEGKIKTQTDWHSLVIWGKLAAFAGQHLKKGSHLFVSGKIKCRKFVDQKGATRYVSEIIVDQIIKL